MKFVKIFANDNCRPLRIDPQDLHPNSRLRGIALREDRTSLRVNVGRDTLRSIVASQRHGHVLCVGTARQQEVVFELHRDCVDVTSVPHVAEPIAELCRQIVAAFVAWPRLRNGFAALLNGRSPEWNASPAHCLLKLAAKPQATTLRDRPLSELALHCLNAWHVFSLEDVMERFPITRLEDEIDKLVAERGSFWHVFYDDEHRERYAIVRKIRAKEDDCAWSARFVDGVKRMHRDAVDISRIFMLAKGKPMMALRFLEHAFAQEGWKTNYVEASNSTPTTPVVFPTAWVVPFQNRNGVCMMLERYDEEPYVR